MYRQRGDICDRELSPQNDISFSFGPYYINPKDGRWTVKELSEFSEMLSKDQYGPVKSRIRNWMSLLFDNREMASQELDRIRSINYGKIAEINKMTSMSKRLRHGDTVNVCPAYDILALNTISTPQTSK